MPSTKYFCVDPTDPSFTVVNYRAYLSPAQLEARKNRRLKNYTALQAKLSDPVEAFFYEKERLEIAAAKRAEKLPKNGGKTFRQLIHEAQLRSSSDRMPLMIRNPKNTTEKGQVVERKVVKNTRQRASRFQKKLESNADEGNFTTTAFDPDFIKSVKKMRRDKNLSQRDLSLLINVKEFEIRAFERNELPFDASLKALLTSQL
jgi:ribosome-binding protein aMBF1 (putative translation factor)